jgi:hypothetical protein
VPRRRWGDQWSGVRGYYGNYRSVNSGRAYLIFRISFVCLLNVVALRMIRAGRLSLFIPVLAHILTGSALSQDAKEPAGEASPKQKLAVPGDIVLVTGAATPVPLAESDRPVYLFWEAHLSRFWCWWTG